MGAHMTSFENGGQEVRNLAKEHVLKFMSAHPDCQHGMNGLKQAQIFKQCGFDWGHFQLANSTRQQYWIVALLWELHKEGKIERVSDSGPWRLA